MKIIYRLLIALLFLSSTANAETSAREKVLEIVEKLKTEVVANKDVLANDKAALLAKAEEIFGPIIDFEDFSKKVMGKYYRRASKSQRVEFAEVTKNTLLNSYGNALLAFDETKINILPPAPKKSENDERVNMEFTTDAGTVIGITFYMVRNDANQWLLSNVMINGINFGLTFRKQFEVIFQRSGNNMDAAIDAWAESLAKQSS